MCLLCTLLHTSCVLQYILSELADFDAWQINCVGESPLPEGLPSTVLAVEFTTLLGWHHASSALKVVFPHLVSRARWIFLVCSCMCECISVSREWHGFEMPCLLEDHMCNAAAAFLTLFWVWCNFVSHCLNNWYIFVANYFLNDWFERERGRKRRKQAEREQDPSRKPVGRASILLESIILTGDPRGQCVM